MLLLFAVRRAGRGKPRSRSGSIRSRKPAFREQDFGAWTGRRHNDLVAELGDAYRDFWKSPASNRPPGGESFVDQISRAKAGLAPLPAGDVVLVVHSGTIRAVLAIALDLEPDAALRFVIDPLSLTRIDRLDQRLARGAVVARSTASQARVDHLNLLYPFRLSPRSVGNPMPAASKPPSTARICPVM